MHTKFQRDWMLKSALKFDHKVSPGHTDKENVVINNFCEVHFKLFHICQSVFIYYLISLSDLDYTFHCFEKKPLLNSVTHKSIQMYSIQLIKKVWNT